MPWHIKRTAILFSTAPNLGFIGVCDMFCVIFSPFETFPRAGLGILLIRRCDTKCDTEHCCITSYFLSNIRLFFIFIIIHIRYVSLLLFIVFIHRVLFRVQTFRDSSVLIRHVVRLDMSINIKCYRDI